jgi:hypothetical protein
MDTVIAPSFLSGFEDESISRSYHERIIGISRLAMLIECEGHITIGMMPPTKTRNRPALYATVGITNTAEGIINEAMETLIDSRVDFTARPLRDGKSAGRKLRRDIDIHGFDRIDAVLNLVLPFLNSKKAQAEIVLSFVASRRKAEPKSAYSDQEWKWATEVRKLNGRQPERKALSKARAYLESSDGSRNPRTIEYFKRYVAMCEELQNCLKGKG